VGLQIMCRLFFYLFFFFPVNSEFCWTSSEEGDYAEVKGFEGSNVDRIISQQHGIQFDPKNKVIEIIFPRIGIYKTEKKKFNHLFPTSFGVAATFPACFPHFRTFFALKRSYACDKIVARVLDSRGPSTTRRAAVDDWTTFVVKRHVESLIFSMLFCVSGKSNENLILRRNITVKKM
jgi:hypothetical protein